MIDVKICGLSTVEAVEVARDNGASHLGYIFFEKSPRNVTAEQARDLVTHKGEARSVAVTVNADDATLDHIVSTMRPDMLQLHGGESIDRVREVKARFGLPVIKALAVRDADDLARATTYDGEADLLLLDAKPSKGADLPGGNGVTFDWSLLDALSTTTPVLLSGGIGTHNIDDALAAVRGNESLIGIDLSSGVESAPGVKDTSAIAALLQQTRTT
ncbi:phosphoribosylanthranilate isomerase [Ahrensia sp. R2A130]|uniref:phosphoribosylanthranilate isomerase n=1 Tax=Ahrensia sp. R2A130 TaxID=744979 RepID=UPI0001E0CA5A|nr:phosphoribosylanthranilate isomerase [Ahrensia sp. R2A130]EFL87652.1 N-(5'phosphoribosyl)anthranilate isomerase [Ahrensia sp. R2A130]